MWQMLKEYLGTSAVPRSREDLLYHLEEAFLYIETCPPKNKEELMQKHSGMSKGMVCEEFWKEKGFNFILDNCDQLIEKYPEAFRYKQALSK